MISFMYTEFWKFNKRKGERKKKGKGHEYTDYSTNGLSIEER